MYNELDKNAKHVIENHAEKCEVCKNKLTGVMNIEISPQDVRDNNHFNIKRFKKLFLLKKINTLLMFLIRMIVIGLITFDFFQHFSPKVPYGLQFEGLRASLVLFYIPLSILLLMFTWFIKNKKIFWFTLIVDIFVIYFFDDMIRLFIQP